MKLFILFFNAFNLIFIKKILAYAPGLIPVEYLGIFGKFSEYMFTNLKTLVIFM